MASSTKRIRPQSFRGYGHANPPRSCWLYILYLAQILVRLWTYIRTSELFHDSRLLPQPSRPWNSQTTHTPLHFLKSHSYLLLCVNSSLSWPLPSPFAPMLQVRTRYFTGACSDDSLQRTASTGSTSTISCNRPRPIPVLQLTLEVVLFATLGI
jgi:hypothetical protein